MKIFKKVTIRYLNKLNFIWRMYMENMMVLSPRIE
jgi:hypothetical protein